MSLLTFVPVAIFSSDVLDGFRLDLRWPGGWSPYDVFIDSGVKASTDKDLLCDAKDSGLRW